MSARGLLFKHFGLLLICSGSCLGSALEVCFTHWSLKQILFFLTSCKPCSLYMESCLIFLCSEIQSLLLKLTSSFYVRSGFALGKPWVSSESAIADPTQTHSRHGTQTWGFIGVCFLLRWVWLVVSFINIITMHSGIHWSHTGDHKYYTCKTQN